MASYFRVFSKNKRVFIMTTWTLSELQANELVNQPEPIGDPKPHDCPAVIVDSGASVEPIPFWGLIDFGANNG